MPARSLMANTIWVVVPSGSRMAARVRRASSTPRAMAVPTIWAVSLPSPLVSGPTR